LVGDSNFLIKYTPPHLNRDVNTLVSLTSQLHNYALCHSKSIEIYNASVWGHTLLEFYVSNVIQGPLVHCECDTVVIGFGTNDSNYFYSLNSNICTPRIHFELLLHLISIYTSATQVRKVILVPVPPIHIPTNPKKNYLTNSMIRKINKDRQSLATSLNGTVSYLTDLNFGLHHLCNDGHHLNHLGLDELAKSVIQAIYSHTRRG